ncbi:MAG: TonB-dependent receptor [Gammaproteobacteria bacterium]
MYLSRVLVITAAVMLSHPAMLFAEDLPEIIVTADPLGEIEGHLVQPMTVLSGEELKTHSIRNIGESIANQPGVSVSDFGAGVGRPVIRGLAGSRVSVLENGINTLDLAGISSDHAVPVETAFAKQIEIFRGPASLLFGNGASGGVINVVNDRITKKVPTTPEGEVAVRYATVSDGTTASGSITTGMNDLVLHLDGLFRSADNYAIPGPAEFGGVAEEHGTLENSGVETRNIAVGLSRIGQTGFASFAVSHFQHEYGVPGEHGHEEHGHEEDEHEEDGHEEDEHEEDMHGMLDEHEDEEGGVTIDMQQTRYDFEAALEEPFAGVRRVRTRWAYNDYEHEEIEGNGEVATMFQNNELEGRVELIHTPVGDWNGVFGLQYRNRDFASIGEESFVPQTDLQSVGLFVLEKSDHGRWHLELGARYDRQWSETVTGMTATQDLFSVSGGVTWHYRDGYEAGLALTRSQRGAAIEELYANGPHLASGTYEIGDAGLDKEQFSNVDIYWRKTAGRFTVSANFFYNRIGDFIFLQEQDTNGDGIADRVLADGMLDEDAELLLVAQKQDDADFFGLELETVLRVMDDKRGKLQLRFWSDYVQGERSNNIKLPRITPWRLGVGGSYRRDGWFATLDYTRVQAQNDTAPLETATGSYNMLSVYAGYTLELKGNSMTLFASGNNLFDDEIRRHTSFVKDIAPLPGRAGTIGMRLAF